MTEDINGIHCPKCRMNFLNKRPEGSREPVVTTCAEPGCSFRFAHAIKHNGPVVCWAVGGVND